MNCLDWEERIALHAGGDATAAEAETVERHLRECAGCQAFWSGLKESLLLLREGHEDVPEAAHFTAVRARVMAELERSRRVWRRLAWISGVAAVVVVMLALWPRQEAVPVAPPRMAAAIPPARLELSPPPKMAARVHERRPAHAPREPLTIQLQTSDPNIVIYWIAD
jgi:hypothetical protein